MCVYKVNGFGYYSFKALFLRRFKFFDTIPITHHICTFFLHSSILFFHSVSFSILFESSLLIPSSNWKAQLLGFRRIKFLFMIICAFVLLGPIIGSEILSFSSNWFPWNATTKLENWDFAFISMMNFYLLLLYNFFTMKLILKCIVWISVACW